MNKNEMNGRVAAVSVSARRGEKKKNVFFAELQQDHGIVGDAHAGPGPRQVSLLAVEGFSRIAKEGLAVMPGDFAENITTRGVDLSSLEPGTWLKIGEKVVLEVSQIGKECHQRCEIFHQVGDCIMPREGVFCRVVQGGIVRPHDKIAQVEAVEPEEALPYV